MVAKLLSYDGGREAKRASLDSTRAPTPTTSATATGQAGDDDVKNADDAGDDGLENRADTVNDGHEAGTDGLEDGFDLVGVSNARSARVRNGTGEVSVSREVG